MAEITCPMCGKPNPADQTVCQYCEARLKPLTDELSRSQPPIRPGEEPQDMDTGQLEPVLPQWLRDIRQQARESAGEDEEPPAVAEDVGQQEESSDLLAGLRSQSEGDEDIPDWLAGLRSEGGAVEYEETSTDEDELATLKSMLGEDVSPPQESEQDALPGWLADQETEGLEQKDRDDLSSFFEQTEAEEPAQPEPESPASSSDFGWSSDFETGPVAPTEATEESSFDTELPAWLQDSDQAQQDDGETELPAWLQSKEPGAPPEGEAAIASGQGDLPDWLASLDREAPGAESAEETTGPASDVEMPDWLASLGEEGPEEISTEDTAEEETAEPEPGDLPGWLAALGSESAEVPIEEPVQPSEKFQAPDWPPSLAEDSSLEEEQEISPREELAGESGTPPTFVDDEGEPISADDVDAIFSMDMPDWLSDAKRTTESEATPDEAEFSEEELRPGDLPGWVQAMRPVESVISETEGVPPDEQPLEERGPLAGLRGVLPAVPGIGPSSKPKAYSIRLQASEDQQASALMLEKMLAEEVEPEPVSARKVIHTQRILRWVIAALLIVVVGATVYYSPGINPIPSNVPLETSAALGYINNTLPANAPVLLVFDYEAARAGEMEAAAAPIIDHMLARKSPRLAMVSSTPVGSGLAERFMRGLPADLAYVRNENFINLGYLPGGAAGVQAFSTDPRTTKQLSTTGEGAWATPVLQGLSQLSDFAAILLLTDNVETARIWIEQTQGDLGEARLLVVASAQAGPMIMPYARSGQVDGMVTGLEGSAPIEAANNARPGIARRYWDAFGFGLLAAVVMIALGSLWSLVSSFQALRKEQGQG